MFCLGSSKCTLQSFTIFGNFQILFHDDGDDDSDDSSDSDDSDESDESEDDDKRDNGIPGCRAKVTKKTCGEIMWYMILIIIITTMTIPFIM